MDEHVRIVKNIASNLRKYIEANPNAPDIPRRHGEVEAIEAITDYVIEHQARQRPVDPDLGDLSDIPAELLSELTLAAPSQLEQRIIAIIKNSDDEKANINTILVELFRRHSVKQKRRNMQNKLWRMTSNSLIWGVDGEKGVYTTIKQEVKKEADPFEIKEDTYLYPNDDNFPDVPF